MKELKIPSEKNFGITFSTIGILIFLYLLYFDNFNLYILLISISLLLISFLIPKILKVPNIIWFRFGILLSKIMTPLILGFIFFGVLGPIAILRKIFNFNKKKEYSTWKKTNKDDKINFKKQF